MEGKRIIYIYTDGGSRGNPGPSATGVYIIDSNNEELHRSGVFIGETTNNVAEYTALLQAVDWLLGNKTKLGESALQFRLDSLLIVNQAKGIYRIKHARLQELMIQIRSVLKQLELPYQFEHVPREKNKMADSMVNHALDNR